MNTDRWTVVTRPKMTWEELEAITEAHSESLFNATQDYARAYLGVLNRDTLAAEVGYILRSHDSETSIFPNEVLLNPTLAAARAIVYFLRRQSRISGEPTHLTKPAPK